MRLVLEDDEGRELTSVDRPQRDFETLYANLADMRFRDPHYPHGWTDHNEALYEVLVELLNHYDHDPTDQ